MRTFGSRLLDARGLADVDGKVRLLPVVVVSGRHGAGKAPSYFPISTLREDP